MNCILQKENVSCKDEGPLFSETLISQDTFALSVKCVDLAQWNQNCIFPAKIRSLSVSTFNP